MSTEKGAAVASRVRVYKDARRVGVLSRDDAGRHEILDRPDRIVREQTTLVRKALLG